MKQESRYVEVKVKLFAENVI